MVRRVAAALVASALVAGAATAAQPRIPGQQLRLKSAWFKPETLNLRTQHVVAASEANGLDFRRWHKRSYSALGMQSGYLQQADALANGKVRMLNGVPVVTVRYLGSTYPTTAAAKRAYDDGVARLRAIIRPLTGARQVDCSATFGASPCRFFSWVTKNARGQEVDSYAHVQLIDSCVAEYSFVTAPGVQTNKKYAPLFIAVYANLPVEAFHYLKGVCGPRGT